MSTTSEFGICTLLISLYVLGSITLACSEIDLQVLPVSIYIIFHLITARSEDIMSIALFQKC